MRSRTALLLCLASILSSVKSFGQINSLQQLLLQTSQAFAPNSTVSSIVLTGQVERSAGGDAQNGTITLTARADGSSTVQMQLGSGAFGQMQDTFANGQGCSWSGADSVSHPAPRHNCFVPLAWFLPEIAFFSSQLPASGVISIPSNDNPSIHWQMTPPTTAAVQVMTLLTHIGAYDLAFDASTFLPTSFSYLAHPDSNAGIDIPVSIRYSDYRTVNSVNIPFHIQRYFNGVLSLDITISNVTVTR